MTLEELLECDATKLESFTDEQLNAWFAPFFSVTRPSNEPKVDGRTNIISRGQAPTRSAPKKESLSAREARVMELLTKKFGDKLK